jgi:hypothetical protein
MVELIQEMFNGKWRDAPDHTEMLHGDQDSLGQSPAQPRVGSPTGLSPSARPFSDAPACSDLDSFQVFKDKRRKRMCIVCRFEGRKDTVSTTHCIEHKVSLCKRSYPQTNSYGCLQSEWSCWEKYHIYYLPRGTFSQSGSVNRSSLDYLGKQSSYRARIDAIVSIVDGAEVAMETQRTLSFVEPDDATCEVLDAPRTPATTLTPAQSVAFSTPSGINTPTPSLEF